MKSQLFRAIFFFIGILPWVLLIVKLDPPKLVAFILSLSYGMILGYVVDKTMSILESK